MRKTFVETLVDIARQDPRVLLLTGDLGYTVLEPFQETFPDRFFNVGVAEQNMIAMGTGLAEGGLIPFLYSIATFAVLRPFEFIRDDAVVHQARVRIVGVGCGFEYGLSGFTHHALDDIGVLRMQPQLKIIAPADNRQAENAMRATWDLPGPVYYRLSKNDGIVPGLEGRFDLGACQVIRSGRRVLIIACGPLAKEAMIAAERLESEGLSCGVAVLAVLNPAPVADLIELMRPFEVVMTLESHYTTGGLGSLVAEIIAEQPLKCRLVRHGVESLLPHGTGSEGALNRRHGLTSEAIVDRLQQLIPVES